MTEWGSTADLDMADHHGRKAAPVEQTKPDRATVRFTYVEVWSREAETQVDLVEVRAWAARSLEVAPADLELTSDMLSDYLTQQFTDAGPDLPSWHPRGEGLKGYDFDRLEVWTAEVPK